MELLGSALLFGSNASFFHSPCRGFFTIFLLEKGANNVMSKIIMDRRLFTRLAIMANRLLFHCC
jgi:hypothetical protein